MTRIILLLVALMVASLGSYLIRPSDAATTGGSGGPQTDRTNLSFTGSKYTSKYHVYAADLDWTKPVGMLIYADGSGEYGLKNPTSTYLLAGKDGMVAVAKRNNMVLVTPLSPNANCSDGNGSCWYLGDTSGYVKWAEEVVTYVQSQYPIDLDRVAMGGYSSGAELATYFWVPSGAAGRTMTDGVIVAISYGGANRSPSASAAFKSNVHMSWNCGDKDPSALSAAQSGYDTYTGAGFDTSIDIVPGVTHDRSGQFGLIMEAQIKAHVKPATGTVTPPNPPPPPGPGPKTGDLNGDGKVNITDLSVLLTNWSKSGVPADLNNSGKVDITDLSVLLSNWG